LRPKAPAPTTAMRRGGTLFAGRGFDGLAAAGVELEEVIDLVVGLGGCGEAEAGGGGRWAADVGVAGDKLEQVEGDVFAAAGEGERRRFHGSMVEQMCYRCELDESGGGGFLQDRMWITGRET